MSADRPRVAVVYNPPVLGPGHPDRNSEASVVSAAGAVADALAGSGFDPVLLDAVPPLSAFVARLTAIAPALVFNLVEAFAGASAAEPFVASVYELLGIAYTGSPVEALASCRSKARTKALLRGLGLPTAPFVVVLAGEGVPAYAGTLPVIVKPEAKDASLGIDQGSVVRDPAALAGRVELVRAAYGGSVLIESYLPGPEFTVGVFAAPEPRALPVSRVVFADRPGAWPIRTYAAKWDEGSSEGLELPSECPALIDPVLADLLGALAVSAFKATGCRDYARVDFRLDNSGASMILEVNPNPDLGPGSSWSRAAQVSGTGYREAVAAIARQALARSTPRRPPDPAAGARVARATSPTST